MTAPAGYTLAFGIPYAVENDDNTLTCPVCDQRIAMVERKDFESFSGREYANHYETQHAVDEGRVLVDGVWYQPDPVKANRTKYGVTVEDILPGTPEWDESERALEVQRRHGG